MRSATRVACSTKEALGQQPVAACGSPTEGAFKLHPVIKMRQQPSLAHCCWCLRDLNVQKMRCCLWLLSRSDVNWESKNHHFTCASYLYLCWVDVIAPKVFEF